MPSLLKIPRLYLRHLLNHMFQQYRYKAKENQIYPVYDCLNLYQTIHQVKANPECRRQR